MTLNTSFEQKTVWIAVILRAENGQQQTEEHADQNNATDSVHSLFADVNFHADDIVQKNDTANNDSINYHNDVRVLSADTHFLHEYSSHVRFHG